MANKDTTLRAVRGALDAHNTILGLERNNGDDVDVWHMLVSLIRFCDDGRLDLAATLEDAADYCRSEDPPAVRRKLGFGAAVGGV